MKKNTIKAFTLVEMLIVIVIIGILIASLMPRMQSAQGRARDVARKNDLSQIQTAIITSQQDKGVWPELTTAKAGMAISGDIVTTLQNAGMTQVPTDPNGSNVVSGLGASPLDEGAYGYMVTKRNSVDDGGFVLMAKTEVEGSSNWLVCSDHAAETDKKEDMQKYGRFQADVDLKDIVLCTEFDKKTNGAAATDCVMDTKGKCTYTDEGQLRYILVY